MSKIINRLSGSTALMQRGIENINAGKVDMPIEELKAAWPIFDKAMSIAWKRGVTLGAVLALCGVSGYLIFDVVKTELAKKKNQEETEEEKGS